jgi:hypothetical protein
MLQKTRTKQSIDLEVNVLVIEAGVNGAANDK